MKIFDNFKPLYTSTARYFLLTSGRAGLKSSTVHDFIARLTYERGHGVLFTRYTMVSADVSVIPEFEETLYRLNIRSDFHIKKTSVINKRTGSFIRFMGIKSGSKMNTGRLKSINGITTWVIEEGEDFDDEKTFNIIDDSIRSSTLQNRILFIMNPKSNEHFIYQRFIKPKSKIIQIDGYDVEVSDMDGVEHIVSSYKMAEKLGYLSAGWLDKVRKSKEQADAMQFEYEEARSLGIETKHKGKYSSQYYFNMIGGWQTAKEGAIWKNWRIGEFDHTLPYCYGQDYGFFPDPHALIKVAVDHRAKRIYVKQMIYETELANITSKYVQIGINKRDLIITDTNEPRTTRRIKNRGYNIKPAKKNEIKEDIREIDMYEIIVDNIDGCSSDVIFELNNWVWNDKKASIPIDANNHLMDGLRYGFVFLTRGRK